LTPPCYRLEPPATAAPFLFPIVFSDLAAGNYVGNFPFRMLDKHPVRGRCLSLGV
jgi:hypothetical protein